MTRLERWLWSCGLIALAVLSAQRVATYGARWGSGAGTAAAIIGYAGLTLWWRHGRPGGQAVTWLGLGGRTLLARLMQRFVAFCYRRTESGSSTHVSDGITVAIDADLQSSREALLQRIGAVLGLLRELAPVRYARLERLAPTLRLTRLPTTVCYVPGADTIVLAERVVCDEPPGAVAVLVASQLVLAYVDRRGIAWSPWTDRWIFRLVVTEVIRLATRLDVDRRPDDAIRAALWVREFARRRVWLADGRRISFDGPALRKFDEVAARLYSS